MCVYMYIYKIIWTSCVAFMACHGRSRGRATGRQSRQCDRQTPPRVVSGVIVLVVASYYQCYTYIAYIYI